MIDRSDIEAVLTGLSIYYSRQVHTDNPKAANYVIFTDDQINQPCLYLTLAGQYDNFVVYIYLYRGDGKFGGLLQIFSDPFDLQQWLIDEFEKYAN